MRTAEGSFTPVVAHIASHAQYDYGIASIARLVARPSPGGPIEIVTLRGLITTDVFSRMVAQIAQSEHDDASVAGVSVFAQSLVVVSAEEMAAAELPHVQAGLLRNPRALVVPAVNVQEFKRYAWMMAHESVGRFVFTDAEMARALRWARTMGRQASEEVAWKTTQATHRQRPSGG